MEAELTGIISGLLFVCFLLSALWLNCLVHEAFVAAVATMASVLAWACLVVGLFVLYQRRWSRIDRAPHFVGKMVQ